MFLRSEKRSKSSKRPSADGHVKTSSAPSTDGKKFEATGTPVTTDGISRTGDRSFFVDETGVIRATSERRLANVNDGPLNN